MKYRSLAVMGWIFSLLYLISINRSIGSYNTSLFQNDPGWWRLQFCLALKPGSGLPCATTTCIFLQTETGRIPTQCHMERSRNHISNVSIARCQNMRQVKLRVSGKMSPNIWNNSRHVMQITRQTARQGGDHSQKISFLSAQNDAGPDEERHRCSPHAQQQVQVGSWKG